MRIEKGMGLLTGFAPVRSLELLREREIWFVYFIDMCQRRVFFCTSVIKIQPSGLAGALTATSPKSVPYWTRCQNTKPRL